MTSQELTDQIEKFWGVHIIGGTPQGQKFGVSGPWSPIAYTNQIIRLATSDFIRFQITRACSDDIVSINSYRLFLIIDPWINRSSPWSQELRKYRESYCMTSTFQVIITTLSQRDSETDRQRDTLPTNTCTFNGTLRVSAWHTDMPI